MKKQVNAEIPLVTVFPVLINQMSDQTNAVKVDIGTKNHLVHIYSSYILLLNTLMVVNNLAFTTTSLPNLNPPHHSFNTLQGTGVLSGRTFTFSRHG